MKVVVLAGGLGTRLSEETDYRPKPMVEIGGRPILWHILKSYAHYGFDDFVIALGYKGDAIKRYFLDYSYLNADLSVCIGGGVTVHTQPREEWTVHLVDTGMNAMTGGRIKRLRKWIGNETFMMTYGDGVANVDISNLVEFHRAHGKLATVTAVRPPARYGGLTIDDQGQVASFIEKAKAGEGWINGGFFVLEPQVLDLIADDDTHWEREPMEQLALSGELHTYQHDGYWQSMDTLRDVRLLNQAWEEGHAPWKVWPD